MEKLKYFFNKYDLLYKALSLALAVALWLMIKEPF